MFFFLFFLGDFTEKRQEFSSYWSFWEDRKKKSSKMFAVMPYDTEDRSAAYRRRVAPRADFVCKYCQRRFTKVSSI